MPAEQRARPMAYFLSADYTDYSDYDECAVEIAKSARFNLIIP
jgi:hypothetical protein